MSSIAGGGAVLPRWEAAVGASGAGAVLALRGSRGRGGGPSVGRISRNK